MKLLRKILLVVILLTAFTFNLTAILKKPSYDELLSINLKPQYSDYEYLKQLDEPVILNHTVKKNEDINTIAAKYGTDVSTIRGINNLEYVILKPEQKIFVINKRGHIHTVKTGETIETIAKKYKINDETILLANGFEDFEEPIVGDKIFIPGIIIHFADFLWPVLNYRITSRFGLRRHPIFRDRRFHEGLDLARWYGAPIRASSDGKIIFAGRKAGYGKTITIIHKNGFSTKYGHLRSYLVKKGQFVKAGQIIGSMGSTGYSTGPHLHFEVRKYNRPVNPLKYLGKYFS
ncbi:MAG: M23 family metallopeptidase [Elusimicrobiota bacterium]